FRLFSWRPAPKNSSHHDCQKGDWEQGQCADRDDAERLTLPGRLEYGLEQSTGSFIRKGQLTSIHRDGLLGQQDVVGNRLRDDSVRDTVVLQVTREDAEAREQARRARYFLAVDE